MVCVTDQYAVILTDGVCVCMVSTSVQSPRSGWWYGVCVCVTDLHSLCLAPSKSIMYVDLCTA